MGLLQFALGLPNTKGESPRDSYSTKPRENPGLENSHMLQMTGALFLHVYLTGPKRFSCSAEHEIYPACEC